MNNGVDKRLKAILLDVAKDTDSEILEMEIMEDHVHLLLSVDPQYGINKVVRTMKGRSSNILRKEFPWLKKQDTIIMDWQLFLLHRRWSHIRCGKTIYRKSKKCLVLRKGVIVMSSKKESTPSSIHEFTLMVNNAEYKELVKLQDLGRILYNACLGESLRRLKMVKQDKFYKETIAIPKDSKENKKLRTENFKILNNRYGFKDSSIQSFAVRCKNESKFLDQLGVHVIQKIATTAFKAVQKIALGKAKKLNSKEKVN